LQPAPTFPPRLPPDTPGDLVPVDSRQSVIEQDSVREKLLRKLQTSQTIARNTDLMAIQFEQHGQTFR
jgi:hypothetical protein